MNRKKAPTEDNLMITHPDLAAEWHPVLNGNLLPSDVSAGSNKKVFWKCKECGYEWAAKIGNRAILRRGCPSCSHSITIKGKNDLATTHPDIAKEWYQPGNGDLTPSDVTYGSGKKVQWICPKGHIYSATILHRTSGGTNCPVCHSGRQTSFSEQAVYYYIKKIYPNAISRFKDIFTNGMELDIYIPDIKLGIEYDGVYWHHKTEVTREREKRKYEICRKNGIKLLRIREKKIDDNEFPAADTSIYLPADEKETDALNHTIQMILAQIDPESNMWTRSRPCHAWSDVRVDVESDRYEILSYLKKPAKNSLATIAPELIPEWDTDRNGGLQPEMFPAGSRLPAHWICPKCGHQWVASINHRAIGHTGCPKCAGLVFEKGFNDLETKNPELLKEWDYEMNEAEGIRPKEIQYNSNVRAHWICSECGHKWVAPIRTRSVDGRGCIQCGYEAAQKLKLEKRLKKQGHITDPLLLKEWDYAKNSAIGLTPQMITPGSNKYAFWICSVCGNEWSAPIARRSNGSGCRKCADKANAERITKTFIEKGHGISDPLLIKEWDYDKNDKIPQEYSYGSNKKAYWICSTCGYSWQATIASRHQGAGCPACAGTVVVQGKNDLMTMRPDIASEWDYSRNGDVTPKDVAFSTNKKYWWVCPKGHESYLAALNHRCGGTGCPICGNQKISEKFSKEVEQYTIDGHFIKTFPSLKQAAAECGVSSSAICRALKCGTTSAGFRWKAHE